MQPHQHAWRFDLGNLYLFVGRTEDYQQICEDMLQQAREGGSLSLHQLALITFSTPTSQEVAEELAEMLYTRYPDVILENSIVRRSYATALLWAGRMDEAEKYFLTLDSHSRNVSGAAHRLAEAFFWKQNGDLARARRSRDKALALLSEDEVQLGPDYYGDRMIWSGWIVDQNMLRQLGDLGPNDSGR